MTRNVHLKVRLALGLAAAVAIGIPSVSLQAQEGGTGTVRGRVVRSGSNTPIVSAQVVVVGTRSGAMTGEDGRFTIPAVPAGEQRLRVRTVGYSPLEQVVRVAPGGDVTADFALTAAVISLDEVVTTGTATAARRREVGNSVGTIKIADVSEASTDVSRLLQGRVAGVNVTGSGANAGAGSAIRLRGNTSVALSNQPLVYIDGVRVRSDEYPKNVPQTGFQGRSANVNASPLNDINPDDIDRIELLKGAAATTLYGTEAAAGVIQIFTKRGTQGRPQWTAQVTQGFNQERPFAPDVADPTDGVNARFLYMDPWLRRGYRQGYALSLAGGTAGGTNYFFSGGFDDNDGVMPLDNERKYLFRGNVGVQPVPRLRLDATASYTNDLITNTPAGNNAHGLTLNAFRRDRNYFGSANVDTISQVLSYEITSTINRMVLGGTATHQFNEHLQNKLTIGLDRADIENRQLRPYGFVAAPQGIISDQRWASHTVTADYVGSFDWTFAMPLRSTFAWGAQSTAADVQDVSGYAEGFAGPGVPTVSSGALKQAFENRQRVITAGVFLQELLGFRDRYFLTLGARVDGNSAFGSNLGLQFYPKVSSSYVVSEEPFWPQQWGTMKLRVAYGQAGRAPGAFDAVQTYQAVGWGTQSALWPLNVGNPDLGPERTAELEAGFDASLLGSRMNLDFTYFTARTKDALLPVRQIPSLGFIGTQLENVGELTKSGVELAVNGTLLDGQRLGWTAGATLATNRSRVVSLGGAVPFELENYGWIMEGQPVAVLRGRKIVNADRREAPIIEQDHLFGPSQPTRIIGVHSALRFWRGLELSARGEYQGGHYLNEDASFQALSRSVRWPTCFDAYPALARGDTASLTAFQRSTCIAKAVRADMFIFPADFFKLRDVTLRVPLGRLIPNTESSTLSLSGANWFRWQRKEFRVFDPEQAGNDGFNAQVRYISEQIPAPATFNAQLRVVF